MSPRILRVSRENNQYQHAEVLRRNRQKRQQFGEFFVEGVRAINGVLEFGWTITAFLYAPEAGLSDWATDILRRSSAALHLELTPALMAQLSEKTETSELIALVAMPEDDLTRIPVSGDLLVVVADRPQNPGNVGTLIRSCDALGANGLIVSGHAVDLYDPEVIRATTGSLFSLPVVRISSPRDLLAWREQLTAQIGSIQLVGMDEHAALTTWEQEFRGPTILLAGNETWGLSAAYLEMATALVRIPIGGFATSLNMAVATSIVLYEIERQRKLREN